MPGTINSSCKIDLYGKIDIPAKVFEEAVTAGKLNGYPDEEIIESAAINEDMMI